jgi:hypothetical protein
MNGTTKIIITTIVDEQSSEAPESSQRSSAEAKVVPFSHSFTSGVSNPKMTSLRYSRRNKSMDSSGPPSLSLTRDVQRCRSNTCPACKPIRRQVRFRSVSPPRPTMSSHSTLQRQLPKRWWDDSSPSVVLPEETQAESHASYTFVNMCRDACLACHDDDDDEDDLYESFSPGAATCSSWTTEDLNPLLLKATTTTSSSLE